MLTVGDRRSTLGFTVDVSDEGHPQLPLHKACDFFLLKKSFTILLPLSQGLWYVLEAE